MAIYLDGEMDVNKVGKEPTYSSPYSNNSNAENAINLPATLQKEINQKCFDEVVEFYNIHEKHFLAFENKTGVNIWFFEHFRLYFTLRTYELKLAAIKQFLVAFPEGQVFTTDSQLQKQIPFANVTFSPAQRQSKAGKTRLLKELWFILKNFKIKPKQNSKHLILSRIEDDVNGADQRFGNLEKHFDKLYNREAFNLSNSLKIKAKGYRSGQNIDQIMARYFLSFSVVGNVLKFRRNFEKLAQELGENTSNCSAINKSIWSLFLSNKSSYLIYYLRYCAFRKYFKQTAYKSILFINENSAQQRAVQHAAADTGVATLGYQHGAIYDLHPAYMYGKYTTKPILPTVTFTWGDYFTNLLIKSGGYEQKSVVTSGRIPAVNALRTVHPNVKADKKIIVYATQPQPDQNLRKREMVDVLNAVKIYANKYQLVLRPHPAEKSDDFFNTCAEEAKFGDFLIDRVSDLQTHFEKSALLITSYSTVGAEYIPYGKPLLVLDYLKADLVNYIKQEVGIPVYNGDELKEKLNSELVINEMAYERFVNNYFYASGVEAEEIVLTKTKSIMP